MGIRKIFYDLEVSQSIVGGYGGRYDFRVVKFIRPQELMCYSYKVDGEKKIHFVHRWEFDTYHEFVGSLWELLDSADITIAHNGGAFDNRMANRFFVTEGFEPPKPRKSVDTLREAKRWFKFESNKLDDLGDFLGVGRKEKIGYADLEDDFMSGNPSKKTLSLLRKYNDQDIVVLEGIYNRMLPYMASHPNMGDITQTDGICPKCGSEDVHPYGSSPRRSGRVVAYRCHSCGGRCNSNTIKNKKGRLVNAN